MSSLKFKIVLVTVPDRQTARRLSRRALEARLVACANLIPAIESHYWWQGKLERSPELLILFKTQAKCLKPLEKLIIAEHPYDTPEFVVLNLESGNKRYLAWLTENSG